MQTFSIILRPIDANIPAEVRLRRLLKAALRGYGLKCVDVREVDFKNPARPVLAIDPLPSSSPVAREEKLNSVDSGFSKTSGHTEGRVKPENAPALQSRGRNGN